MPSVPRYVGKGAAAGSTLVTSRPSDTQYSCTPNEPDTWSPTENPECREAITLPTAPARITSPSSTGRM